MNLPHQVQDSHTETSFLPLQPAAINQPQVPAAPTQAPPATQPLSSTGLVHSEPVAVPGLANISSPRTQMDEPAAIRSSFVVGVS